MKLPWPLIPWLFFPNVLVSVCLCVGMCVYLSGLVGRSWEEAGKGSSRQGWSWLPLTEQKEEPLSLPTLLSFWARALLLPCQKNNTHTSRLHTGFYMEPTISKLQNTLKDLFL